MKQLKLKVVAEKTPNHWPHQLKALRFILGRTGSLLWVPMRAGKTRIAIDDIQRGNGPDLIICPYKVIPVWVEEEFPKYLSAPREIYALGEQTIKERAEIVKKNARKPKVVFVTNWQAFAEQPLAKELLKVRWAHIYFDECHRLQAAGGKQSRFAARLAKKAYRVVGLTGTPGNPMGKPKNAKLRKEGILDLYGVMRTLAPGLFADTVKEFRAKYGIWNPFTPYPKLDGYQNQKEYDKKLKRVCYHVKEEDLAYTMPRAIEQTIPVKLPSKVKDLYDELEAELTADWGKDSITADNQLVKQLRLQQLAAGFLKLDDEDKETQVHSVKIDATVGIISDLPEDERVLVFCHFKPEMDALAKQIRKLKRPAYFIRGGVDEKKEWNATPGAVLIAQDQAGSEGLDLSATNYCIFNSLSYSLRLYQQCFKRPQKPNKKHPVAYYFITAQGTVDETIRAALKAGEEVVDSVSRRLRKGGTKKVVKKKFKLKKREKPVEEKEMRDGHVAEEAREVVERSLAETLDELEQELADLNLDPDIEDVVAPDEEKAEKPKKKLKIKKKAKASKEQEAFDYAVETPSRAVKAKSNGDGDVVTLKGLANEYGVEGKKARKLLRKHIERADGRWEWSSNDPELVKVRKILEKAGS